MRPRDSDYSTAEWVIVLIVGLVTVVWAFWLVYSLIGAAIGMVTP